MAQNIGRCVITRLATGYVKRKIGRSPPRTEALQLHPRRVGPADTQNRPSRSLAVPARNPWKYLAHAPVQLIWVRLHSLGHRVAQTAITLSQGNQLRLPDGRIIDSLLDNSDPRCLEAPTLGELLDEGRPGRATARTDSPPLRITVRSRPHGVLGRPVSSSDVYVWRHRTRPEFPDRGRQPLPCARWASARRDAATL